MYTLTVFILSKLNKKVNIYNKSEYSNNNIYMHTLNPFILSNWIKKVNKKVNIYNKSGYSINNVYMYTLTVFISSN